MSESDRFSAPLSERTFSRRAALKRALGAVLLAPIIASIDAPQASAANFEGGDEAPTNILSNSFREHKAIPLNEQAEIVQANYDRFMDLRSKPILALGEELHAKLYEDYPNTNPPMLARDLDSALQMNEPFYQLADANDPTIPYTSMGLLKEMGQSPDRPNVAFSCLADSLLLGITNHKFFSENGPVDIQVAHLGGFYGSEKKGRWKMPVYLGYTPEDPAGFTPPRTWIESKTEEEDVIPFKREGVDLPRVPYQSTVNRLFDTVGESAASFFFGLDYEIDAFDEASMVDEMNGPYELFTHEFLHENETANRNAYEWLTRKAIFAASQSETQQVVLLPFSPYYSADSTPQNILDVFPDAGEKSAAPKITTSEEIFEKPELTIEDLAGLPSAYLARIKLSASPTF